jgi:hypothetical protein
MSKGRKDELWKKVVESIIKVADQQLQIMPQPHKARIASTTQEIEIKDIQRQQREIRIYIHGNVEFVAIEPRELGFAPVIVQALDNQWLPLSLLRKEHFSSSIENLEEHREKLVRAEYIRALINGRQIVINRAYLYNNPLLFRDYLPGNPNREAFKSFLTDGTIVPFLLQEKTPDKKPAYDTLVQGFEAWQQLCQEVRMHCLRLSWDDKENGQMIRSRLAQRFHDFAQNINTRNINAYIREFRLDQSIEISFRRRLNDVVRLCLDFFDQDKLISRNDLYKEFVTLGDNTAKKMYDVSKPFASEIKQIIDLAYNSYLADALNGYLLVPLESLSTAALQEWYQTKNQLSLIIPSNIRKVWQQAVFPLIQAGLYLKSTDLLSLQDVQEIRKTEEWKTYIESLEALLQQHFEFAEELNSFVEGAAKIFDNYIKLAWRIRALKSEYNPSQNASITTGSFFSPEIIFNVGGAGLSIELTNEGVICKPVGEGSLQIAQDKDMPFLIQSGSSEAHVQPDIYINREFLKSKLQEGQEQWGKMLSYLKDFLDFQEFFTS